MPAATLSGIQSNAFYVGLVACWHTPKEVLHTASFPQAASDAKRMNVDWVIVWPTHLPHTIKHYLEATGFKVAYRVRQVVVYHR